MDFRWICEVCFFLPPQVWLAFTFLSTTFQRWGKKGLIVLKTVCFSWISSLDILKYGKSSKWNAHDCLIILIMWIFFWYSSINILVEDLHLLPPSLRLCVLMGKFLLKLICFMHWQSCLKVSRKYKSSNYSYWGNSM